MKTEDRDAILGKAIVRTFQKKDGTEHPEAEELAALIDNKLGPDEKSRVMEHVASCDRCYELFTISSEMAKERHEVSRTARFKMPLALAASLLIVVGAFLAYKGLHVTPTDIVALKASPQEETAPRLPAPTELKGSPSLTASVPGKSGEETKPRETTVKGRPASVLHARIAVDDAVGEFLNDAPDDIVTDENKIVQLVALLSKDTKSIGGYDINEVRIEWGETLTRSAQRSFEKAEITIRNGVLTIRLLDRAASDGR